MAGGCEIAGAGREVRPPQPLALCRGAKFAPRRRWPERVQTREPTLELNISHPNVESAGTVTSRRQGSSSPAQGSAS
eukprot:454247-Prymnesium_polylepis.2